jgi:hypothetical protein
MAACPPGTLFAARATQVGVLAGAVTGRPAARNGLRRGTLTFGRIGVTFTHSGRPGSAAGTAVAWQQVCKLKVAHRDGQKL